MPFQGRRLAVATIVLLLAGCARPQQAAGAKPVAEEFLQGFWRGEFHRARDALPPAERDVAVPRLIEALAQQGGTV